MRTREFRCWLETEYLQRSGKPLTSGTQVSRTANCSTVEQFEGDLDEQFEHDGLAGLLHKLSYTSEQRDAGKYPRHRIPINGDAVNGSTTYRSAIQLYRKFRVAALCNLADVEPDSDAAFVTEMIEDSLTATERLALVKSRIGQGRFRSLVLEIWDYRCAVTSSGLLLTASHIKPWKVASNAERLDGWNGLALSPTFDRAFDVGLVSFANDGFIMLSPRLPVLEASRLGIRPVLRIDGLGKRHHAYLECHRDSVFLK